MDTDRHQAAGHGRLADRAAGLFYAVVLSVALVGSSEGASTKLGWPIFGSLAAVSAAELGGVVLSIHADSRRRLGEHAVMARVLSAAVAVGAVLINFFGHSDKPFQAYFFAGFSALGYTVYLIRSAAKYRDAQRAAGKMVDTAPAYGMWQWIRHPAITCNARRLAIADPKLGTVASLDAARNAKRDAARRTAIAAAVRERVADRAGPVLADIATLTYDMDQVAAILAARADYHGLAGLIASELTAERLAPVATPVAIDVEEALQAIEAAPVAATPSRRKAPKGKARRRPQPPRRRPAATPPAESATTDADTVATDVPEPPATNTDGPAATVLPIDRGSHRNDDLMAIVRPLVAAALNAGRKAPGQRAVYDAIKAARNGQGIGFPRVQELIDQAIAEYRNGPGQETETTSTEATG